MGYRYNPSRADARDFAQKMQEIEEFCHEHGISHSFSNDSYYFVIGDVRYRVSNHTTAASDRGMYDDFGNKVRDSYHEHSNGVVCITASKTRIVEIYTALMDGKQLDKRGNVIS